MALLEELSKPIVKLIEVCASGCGAIWSPYRIKKDADARSYEIDRVVQTFRGQGLQLTDVGYSEGKVTVSGQPIPEVEALPELKEGIAIKLEAQQQKRERNINTIALGAAEEVKLLESVSEEPVDEDWIARFFSHAQDVSNEQMQQIWGKLLAGEVNQPGSFSLRTLDTLRNLTPDEASTFAKLAKWVVEEENGSYVLAPSDIYMKETYGLIFNDIMLLKDLGLINYDPQLIMSFPSPDGELVSFAEYGKYAIIVRRQAHTPMQQFRVALLTKIGRQLATLVEKPFNLDYVRLLASELKHEGVSVEYGRIMGLTKDGEYMVGPTTPVTTETS